MTKACDFKKVFQVNDKILVGFSGLATDLQTLEQRLRMRCNMYKLREEREISVDAFGNLVASMQYEKRCALAHSPPPLPPLPSRTRREPSS